MNLDFSFSNWGFHNFLETKHVLKTSWNLRTNKERLKNFSSKMLEKRGFGDWNI